MTENNVSTTASTGASVPFYQEVKMPAQNELPGILRLTTGIITNRRDYDPAVCLAVCSVLPAFMNRGVTFEYPGDIKRQICTLMSMIVGGFSSGKSFPLTIAEHVLRDVLEKDRAEREKEEIYKEKLSKATKAKEGGKVPTRKVYDIQVISPNATGASFLRRQIDAMKKGSICISMMPECDRFYAFAGGKKSLTELLRSAYEAGDFTAERVSMDAVTGTCKLAWSTVTTTTHQQLIEFLINQVENGLVSRITMCEIPESADETTPKFKKFDDEFYNSLKPYTDRLRQAKAGEYTVPELEAWVERQRKRIATYTSVSGDQAIQKLSRRALLSAARIGFLLYITEDWTWSKSIEKYITFVYCHSLDMLTRLFGDSLKRSFDISKMYATHKATGRPSLLPMLPDKFSLENLLRVREAADFPSASDPKVAKEQARNWVRAKLIKKVAKGEWEKVK